MEFHLKKPLHSCAIKGNYTELSGKENTKYLWRFAGVRFCIFQLYSNTLGLCYVDLQSAERKGEGDEPGLGVISVILP